MANDSKTIEWTFDRFTVLPDIRNSQGHGFDVFEYDGLYFYIFPKELYCTKGEQDLREGIDGIKQKFSGLKSATLDDQDVIILAYPKCGTHWLWEIIEMLKSGKIQYIKEVKETRMMEFIFKDRIEALPAPRTLNTHLPLRMLPSDVTSRKLKCFQILRNPKDVCVSMFNHFSKLIAPYGYDGDFKEFTETYLSGNIPFGSYHNYIKSWTSEKKTHPDLPTKVLYYEDMLRNPMKNVREIANFLELNVTDEFCKEVAEACTFKKMKEVDENKVGMPMAEIWKEGSGGTFYRKGEIGDWKNWFTVAENERFDKIWNESMQNTEFEFVFE